MATIPYQLTTINVNSDEFLEENNVGSTTNGVVVSDYGKYIRTSASQELPAPTASELGKPMIIYNTGSLSITITAVVGVTVVGLNNVAPNSAAFVYPTLVNRLEMTGGI